nr:MAG TPA: hypothetical protein [Caudoviricetes sp.]
MKLHGRYGFVVIVENAPSVRLETSNSACTS